MPVDPFMPTDDDYYNYTPDGMWTDEELEAWYYEEKARLVGLRAVHDALDGQPSKLSNEG